LTTFTLFPYTTLFRSLDHEMTEEFKAAVKIERHPTELPKSGVDYNPDYLPVLVTIDPDRLLEIWGDREINDGRNISGFIRTADEDRKSTRLNSSHVSI